MNKYIWLVIVTVIIGGTALELGLPYNSTMILVSSLFFAAIIAFNVNIGNKSQKNR